MSKLALISCLLLHFPVDCLGEILSNTRSRSDRLAEVSVSVSAIRGKSISNSNTGSNALDAAIGLANSNADVRVGCAVATDTHCVDVDGNSGICLPDSGGTGFFCAVITTNTAGTRDANRHGKDTNAGDGIDSPVLVSNVIKVRGRIAYNHKRFGKK